jgi:hypothetical protein
MSREPERGRLHAQEIADAIDQALAAGDAVFEQECGDSYLTLKWRGWSIVFFLDAGDCDYVEKASDPNLRVAESDVDWFNGEDPPRPEPLDLRDTHSSDIVIAAEKYLGRPL